jgi:molybdopterin molybdotransferase
MLSVEEAKERILSEVAVLEEETKPILDCLGQVLAEDISSTINVPPSDNSGMDGYAVRAGDTKGAGSDSPCHLRVIDTVLAGTVPRCEVVPGTAVRIMTGAPIPPGADAVVRFEDTDEAEREQPVSGPPETVAIRVEVKVGRDIRPAGGDITEGAEVLTKGRLIRPAEIGVLASLGRTTARVIRRPVVAVLATGDELVEAGQPLMPGKIYNSNSYSVAAQVRRYGGIPKTLGTVSDSETALKARFAEAAADLFITTGGVSMGDYDVVKDVLASEGEVSFWKVRVKPGKPIAFGRLRGKGQDAEKGIVFIGLPGNPVSGMVTFELFVRPALLKMMGRQNLNPWMIEAVITDPVVNNDGRRIYTRAIVEARDGAFYARLTGPQGSGILTSMSSANGLAIIPEDKARVEAGEKVQVVMTDWSEEIYC